MADGQSSVASIVKVTRTGHPPQDTVRCGPWRASYAPFGWYHPLVISALMLAEEVTGEGRDVNNHTFIGLGLMAMILVVIWLIHRSRA